MFHRKNCRIAHSSPDVSPKNTRNCTFSSPFSSSYESFYLCSPPSTSNSCGIVSSKSNPPQKKFTVTVRRKVLRIRPSLLLRLLKKIRAMVSIDTRSRSSDRLIRRENHGSGSRRFGTGLSAYCTHSSCAPDAIADCIEFIKRSSSQPTLLAGTTP